MSLGFFLALWSGSRALNVFVDTITIMHGLGGQRGIVKTRALSFSLYLLAHGHRGRRRSRWWWPAPDWWTLDPGSLRIRDVVLLADR